jgi:hypothetical protein
MRMQWLARASRLLLCSLLGQTTLPSAANAAEKKKHLIKLGFAQFLRNSFCSHCLRQCSHNIVKWTFEMKISVELFRGTKSVYLQERIHYSFTNRLTDSFLVMAKIFWKILFQIVLYNHIVILWTASFNWIERCTSEPELCQPEHYEI